MSLTPDYFISSCGYPQLNREKFIISTAPPSSGVKFVKGNSSENNHKNLRHLACDSDKKKLLKKRGKSHGSSSNCNVINMTVTQNRKPCKWASDKERKCYMNQQIKKWENNQNDLRNSSSNQQLDNRLASEDNYLNGIFRDNQTDVFVLQSVDF